MCFHYLDDKKSISKLHNSTILHSAVKVWPPRAVTLQKYFFSLVQLMPYKYGFRGYLHFFCTIANKNTATTYVRTGGLCYKTREICHGENIGPSKKVLNAIIVGVGPFPLYGEKSRLIVLVGYFCYTDAINFSLLSIAAKVALLHCNGLWILMGMLKLSLETLFLHSKYQIQ